MDHNLTYYEKRLAEINDQLRKEKHTPELVGEKLKTIVSVYSLSDASYDTEKIKELLQEGRQTADELYRIQPNDNNYMVRLNWMRPNEIEFGSDEEFDEAYRSYIRELEKIALANRKSGAKRVLANDFYTFAEKLSSGYEFKPNREARKYFLKEMALRKELMEDEKNSASIFRYAVCCSRCAGFAKEKGSIKLYELVLSLLNDKIVDGNDNDVLYYKACSNKALADKLQVSAPKQSICFYRESLTLFKKLYDISGNEDILKGIGVVYEKLSELTRRKENLEKTIEYYANYEKNTGEALPWFEYILERIKEIYEQEGNQQGYADLLKQYKESITVSSMIASEEP